MKKLSLRKSVILAMAMAASPMVISCSTGTDSGQTNVEDSSGKDVHEKSGNEKSGEGIHDNQSGADR